MVEIGCAFVIETATDELVETSIWPGEITPVGVGDSDDNEVERSNSTGAPKTVYVCVSVVPSAPRVVKMVV